MPIFQSQSVKLSNIITKPIQTGFQVREKTQQNSQDNYNLIQMKSTMRGVLYQIQLVCSGTIFLPKKKIYE